MLISAAAAFNLTSQLSALLQPPARRPTKPDSAAVEVLSCADDNGPGTKLLCALARLRSHAGADAGGRHGVWVALADDDLRYKPWVLRLLEAAIREDARSERHAYAFDVYTMTRDGRAVTAGMWPGLLVGSGHAVHALRLSLLDGIEAFFECVRALEPLAVWHDDLWISMYVQDVRRATVWRIGGTAYETAHHFFPEAHASSRSYKSRGALSARRKADASLAAPAAGADAAAAPTPAGATRLPPDRTALIKAMGLLRQRLVFEGRCGVPQGDNSSLCVGAWCAGAANREWGAHASRLPWEHKM